ncbi:MAG: acetyl-CoA carboxylase, biotin carboxyl carrier protein [Alphaproteobacteria bacterium]|nr:acetyl-CoA carboxylase, biotin carboxyl carrier protein [Alphaproteobacteria bacterium]
MKAEHKELIKELSALLKENNLHEIEYQENGVLLKVVGQVQAQAVPVVQPVAQSQQISADKPKEEKNILTSPMVGVVYLSPSPDAPAYVKVGDTVSVGQTICLVEAMKTFNPITAQKAGKIKAVLIDSGVPVEYNQPLFELE